MADKTDTAKLLDDFLGRLEKLYLRHQAFFQMAKDADVRWAIQLNRYRQANGASIAQQFDAVRAEFQRNPSNPDVIRKLSALLDKAILAKEFQ